MDYPKTLLLRHESSSMLLSLTRQHLPNKGLPASLAPWFNPNRLSSIRPQKAWIIAPNPTIKKRLDDTLQIHCMFTTGDTPSLLHRMEQIVLYSDAVQRKPHIVQHNHTVDLMVIYTPAKVWIVCVLSICHWFCLNVMFVLLNKHVRHIGAIQQ